MRPKSIVRFEAVYWLWLAANLASLVLAWPATAADPQMQSVLSRMPWFPYVVGGMLLLVLAGIGLAVARGRSAVGRWLVVLFALVSAGLFGREIANGYVPSDLAGLVSVAAALLAVAAAVLLFLPDARDWFVAADDIEEISVG